MTWAACIVDNDYEICDEYPYSIRRVGYDENITESIDESDGYVYVSLNCIKIRKHIIIAKQWIPNPDNLPCVDHYNKHRDDNHLSNLHWCSNSDNQFNKSIANGVAYEFVSKNDAPTDMINIPTYGNHTLIGYYYSPTTDQFYKDVGIEYRIMYVNHSSRNRVYVCARDVNHKKVSISIKKYKQIIGRGA